MNHFQSVWETAKTRAAIDGLKIIEHGWKHHVIIDEVKGVVYRYPRHEQASHKLDDEVSVLPALNQLRLPSSIPVMREHTPDFSSYDYIPGEVMQNHQLSQLSPQGLNRIGRELGHFMAALNRADMTVVQGKKTKQSISLLEYYTSRIEEAKNTPFYKRARVHLKSLSVLVDSDSHKSMVVVHGDLYGPNIVIDPKQERLNGVIDFSEVEIGERHQDFRKLFMTDSRLLESALDGYEESAGFKLDSERIKLWAYVNEWANLCHFAGQPGNETYKRAYQHLEVWGQA